jgi:hypothetical protein
MCTIINHITGAAVAPGSGGTPQKLWDVFSSTDLMQSYQRKTLSKAFGDI